MNWPQLFFCKLESAEVNKKVFFQQAPNYRKELITHKKGFYLNNNPGINE